MLEAYVVAAKCGRRYQPRDTLIGVCGPLVDDPTKQTSWMAFYAVCCFALCGKTRIKLRVCEVLGIVFSSKRSPRRVRRCRHDLVHMPVTAAKLQRFHNGNHDLRIRIGSGKRRGKLHSIEAAVSGDLGHGDFPLGRGQGTQAGLEIKPENTWIKAISRPKRCELNLLV